MLVGISCITIGYDEQKTWKTKGLCRPQWYITVSHNMLINKHVKVKQKGIMIYFKLSF